MKRSLIELPTSWIAATVIVAFVLGLNVLLLPSACFASELENDEVSNVVASQGKDEGDGLSENSDEAGMQPLPKGEEALLDEDAHNSDLMTGNADAEAKQESSNEEQSFDEAPAVLGDAGMAATAEEDDSEFDLAPSFAKPAEMQAASAQEASIANGVYTIVASTGGSKCLDVPYGSSSNGVQLQIYTQNVTAAQRWRITGLGAGLYEIVNVGSGKALDVSGARKASGVAVQQYSRNSTLAQKWKLVSSGSGKYKIVSALSDSLVLDVTGGSAKNGARVQIWKDNGSSAQSWSFVTAKTIDDGFYVVKNGSGKVLDVSGGSLNSGANIQQYGANGTAAQTFYLSYGSSDGYYTITDLGSGRVLDVANGSSSNGANVQQYTANGTRAQKWAAVKNSDGTITFRSAISGLALDVRGGSSSNGANVQVYASNGTKAQKWTLSTISNWLPEGAYTIISTLNTGNVIDVAGGRTASGTNVQVYSNNSTNAQRYYLRSMGDGCYTIQNPISGLYLNVAKNASGANVLLGTTQQQFKPVFRPGGIVFQLKGNSSLVLDIANGSTRDGANVQVYASNGTQAQRFVVRSADMLADGVYSIRYAANSDYVIDVPNASTSSGQQLQLYSSNGTQAQRFKFVRVGSNTYKVTAMCSGKALQAVKVSDGSYQLQQRNATSGNDQQWMVTLLVAGPIQLAPKSNSGLRVDLKSNAVSNGTTVHLHSANGTSAQNWKLVSAAESTTYDALGLTLRRMAELQKSGGNNSALTVNQLMDLLDPSNLDKSQFLDVRVVTDVTAGQLNSFITSTSTGRSGVLQGLGSSFISAAKQYGINEVYLLAHAILESGWGTSDLARGYYYGGGTIDGKYYPAGTYYNFYGIGAYDSSPLSGGRKLAIINGWNSKEKAVTGAAKWIANNYVYASSYAQPTLYAMKWDYARTNATGERGWHQYATSTSWPASIANLINQCYSTVGGNLNQVYIIPKYK